MRFRKYLLLTTPLVEEGFSLHSRETKTVFRRSSWDTISTRTFSAIKDGETWRALSIDASNNSFSNSSRDPSDDCDDPFGDFDDLKMRLEEECRLQVQKSNRGNDVDQSLIHEYSREVDENTCTNLWNTYIRLPLATFPRPFEQKRLAKLKRIHGPTGHSYKQCGRPVDTLFCDLSMNEIDALLSHAELCRMEARYEDLQAISFELELHGVYICELTKSWRADGNV